MVEIKNDSVVSLTDEQYAKMHKWFISESTKVSFHTFGQWLYRKFDIVEVVWFENNGYHTTGLKFLSVAEAVTFKLTHLCEVIND